MPISLSELQGVTDVTVPHVMKSVSLTDSQNLGRSSEITYQPPEEHQSILERISNDVAKPIAQTQKFIGSAMYVFGDTIGADIERDKAAREMADQYPEGFLVDDHRTWNQKLGDRMASAGLIMIERNDKAVAEKYPGNEQWLDHLAQSTPAMGGVIGLGALLGAGPAIAAGAITAGAQSGFDTYIEAKRKGKTSAEADRIATLMGLGVGGASAFGIDRFFKGTGAWFKRTIQGAVAGFVGMAGQSLAGGTIKLATGLEEYNGKESLVKLMEDAAYTGSIGAALGGAVSMPIVMAQHKGLAEGFKKMGYSERLSNEYATKVLKQGAHDIVTWVEKELKYTPDEVSRIKLSPTASQLDLSKLKTAGEQKQRMDALDVEYNPNQRSEVDITDRQQEIAQIKESKDKIKEYRRQLREAELNKEQREILQKEIERLSDLNPRMEREKITLLKDQVRQLKQGFREGRDITQDEIKDVQSSVVDVLKTSDLEPADKSKFLTAVKNIQTKDQLAQAMPEIQNRIINLEQRAQQKRMIEDIRKVKSEALPIEYQDSLKDVLKNFDLKRRSKGQVIEKEKTRAFFEQKLSQEEPLSPSESKALDLARTKSLSEMTHEEFTAVHDLVMGLVHQGRLKNKLLSMSEARNYDQWRAEKVKNITEGLPEVELNTLMADAVVKNTGLIGKTKEQILDHIASQLLPEVKFNWLGMEDVFQKVHDSVSAKETAYNRTVDTFRRMYSKIDLVDAYNKKVDIEIPFGNSKIEYKGKKALSLSQVAEVYALAQNEKGLKHLEGSGLTKVEVDGLSKWLEDNHPDMIDAINQQFKYYDEVQYPRIDSVVVKTRGVHMAQETPYFPFKDLIDVPENLVEKGMYERAHPFSGFTKARLNSEVGIAKFDYFGKVLRNAAEVEHYINMAEVVHDLNKIFTDPVIKDAITRKFGDKWVPSLQKLVKDLAWNGNEPRSRADNIMRTLRENMVVAKLGFNFMTQAKQWTNYSVGARFVGGNWVNVATKDLLFAGDKWRTFIDDKSEMMRSRAYTQEKELIEMVKDRGVKGLQPFALKEKFIKESMAGLQFQDKIVAGTVWLGQYRKALAEGIGTLADDRLAIAEADRAVRRTQSMGGTLYIPDFFRGGEVAKILTLFQNQTNKQFNLLADLARDAGLGKISKAEFADKFLAYVITPAVLYGLFTRKRAQEGDEVVSDIVNQSVGQDVMLGFLTQMWAFGADSPNTPLGSSLNDLKLAVTAKKPETKFKYAIESVSDFTGLPLRNVRRAITGEMFKPSKSKTDSGSGTRSGYGRSGG